MAAKSLKKNWSGVVLVTLAAAVFFGFLHQADAATLYVNSGGMPGSYPTIRAALKAANSGDTIDVAPGVYKEDVVIDKPLSIVGADPETTIVDAAGLGNGFYVDGTGNHTGGLNSVVIEGFTVENAKYEGILVNDASSVTILNDRVIGNDTALRFSAKGATCSGLPGFETDEGFDCGEGIHLIGVTSSTVSNNFVVRNAGGILLSDETGATSGNLVTGNRVEENPYDCGITLASHSASGVFANTISENISAYNGLGAAGAGAGVGIFAGPPGAGAYGNRVVDNVLEGNGLPGVAIHSHTPNQDLDGNIITGNLISGNGTDVGDTPTPGPTGINVATGIYGGSPIANTVIADNTINKETDDVVANTSPLVDIHANDLLGEKTGIDNLGGGTVNATENWWGCANGPGFEGCSDVAGTVVSSPFLSTPVRPGDR